MDEQAAKQTTELILQGVFDVFNAMFGMSFNSETGVAAAFDADALDVMLGRFPYSMSGILKSGAGAVALLFSIADAARFASKVLDKDPGDGQSLNDEQRGILNELADPVLGGGVAQLMQHAGRMPEQFTTVKSADTGVQAAPAMRTPMTGGAIVEFSFSAEDGTSSRGVLIVGKELIALCGAATEPVRATVSPEEMNDILGGFETPAAPPPPPQQHGPRTPIPDNLDMVLDIRLEATARLGRVQMAIGDILALGPGSIVEVGHLVDEPVDLLVNNKLVARGDVVVVDEKFGLRITEIVSQRERIESMR